MKMLKWAAVAVTALFALMNLGVVPDGDMATAWRVFAAAAAVAGLSAAAGMIANQSWGRMAVIGIGAINLVASVIGLFTDQQGAVLGVVVGGLSVVLGVLAVNSSRPTAAV